MVINKFKTMNKTDIFKVLGRYGLIIAGTVLIAFGSAVFLVPCKIIAGGLSGIALIVDHYVQMSYPGFDSVDITIGILTWVLFFIGLIFLGKKFSLKTLLATIVYPLMFMLFTRFHLFDSLILEITAPVDGVIPSVNVLLAGLFGGAIIGVGCALTFIGGGSSGGVDIIYFIVEKYIGIKQSITSFALDATIIIVGMLILDNVIPSFIGILSALMSAIMIQFIYIQTNTYYVVEVITDKWKEVSVFVQDVLGRGVTYIDAKGGYKNDDRKIIRIACSKYQSISLKDFIARIDTKAFMTITQSKAVIGAGFDPHKPKLRIGKNKEKDKPNS
ncbi:MAG: YitT family protein [Bacilli bacterium]